MINFTHPMHNPTAPRVRGFTLIELVVAMLIGAILVSIAIPSYNNYVRQSRRTDAKSALLDLASLEERYYSTQNAYSVSASDLGYPTAGLWPITIGSGYYQIQQPTIVPAQAPTVLAPAGTLASYTLVANPVPGTDQAKDTACASFTVTSSGGQTATNSSNVDNTQTCWH